jgi:alanine-glyoxylate transaminase/serine-glyoxylate transaminase/serine-pyruvate transaminase
VFTETEARAFLEKERPQLVAFVHGETSTGAMQAAEAITRPAREVGALVIADCVTTLGSVPVRVDETGIDIAYSCTQKGLSAPPGLSPFTLSPRAVERLNARTTPNRIWYLDLKMLMDYYDGGKYHHTAPVSMFYALREALAAIQEEGVEHRFARHLTAHASFVRRIEAMGLKMHVAAGQRLTTLNTPRIPEGVDDAEVRRQLLDEYGIEVAGGFGPLAGKILRIGVMGPLATESSLDRFFEAFGKCLAIHAAT